MDQAKCLGEIPISYEEKGKEIGKEIGREETQSRIALNMLRKELDIEFIAETTMLSKGVIVELRKQLD